MYDLVKDSLQVGNFAVIDLLSTEVWYRTEAALRQATETADDAGIDVVRAVYNSCRAGDRRSEMHFMDTTKQLLESAAFRNSEVEQFLRRIVEPHVHEDPGRVVEC